MQHWTQLNWPLAVSELSYSPCCLFRAAFPLAPLKEMIFFSLVQAALFRLHISQVPSAPLPVGLLFITVT